MSAEGNARVLDLKTIERFKSALIGFGESVKAATMEADSEIGRAINWLENDRVPYWRTQIRKRQDLVTVAKSELFRKQMQGSNKDGRPSDMDEKRQLQQAIRMLEHARYKLENCKKWRNRLEREYSMYKGQTSGLGTIAEKNVPEGVARLERILDSLEDYVSSRSGNQNDLQELLEHDSAPTERRARSGAPTPPETPEDDSETPSDPDSEEEATS